MASGGARQTYHQDYIARIRHSNALPVPPLPPKLLDIPNTGLSSGQYTNPSFATRLLREQPLTIDADEFGLMDFNPVGFPGAFEGDDRYLKFQDWEVVHDQKDKALLRPLNALGKASTSTQSGVNFLRKSEVSGTTPNIFHKQKKGHHAVQTGIARKDRQTDAEKEDPKNILRHIIKGFNLAYPQDAYRGPDTTDNLRGAAISQEEREAWERPRHPLRPELTVVDRYPILPDIEALPDVGGYMMIKFQHNPGEMREQYDPRLDVAILRVRPLPKDAQAVYDAKRAIWEADPSSGPEPQRVDDFELFLPESVDSVRGIKRKFSTTDPQADDPLLYDAEAADGEPCFRFKKARRFETQTSQFAPNGDPYSDALAIALHDPESHVGLVPGSKSRLQKGAYYYPILHRVGIRAYRPRPINSTRPRPSQQQQQQSSSQNRIARPDADEDDEGRADQLNVIVVPEEDEQSFAELAVEFRKRLEGRTAAVGVEGQG